MEKQFPFDFNGVYLCIDDKRYESELTLYVIIFGALISEYPLCA